MMTDAERLHAKRVKDDVEYKDAYEQLSENFDFFFRAAWASNVVRIRRARRSADSP